MEFQFNNEKMKMLQGKYKDDTPAIVIQSFDKEYKYWEDYATLTVCIPGVVLKEDQYLIKTWSENEVFEKFLVEGYFTNTGVTVPTGFVKAKIWEITEKGKSLLEEI